MKVGRNDPCTCGSGRKYKHCCERAKSKRDELTSSVARGMFILLIPAALVLVAVVVVSALRKPEVTAEPSKIWSAAHNHWHYLLPDGREIEVRPGLVWSPEQNQFVQGEPLTEAARKHTTSGLDQRIDEAADSLGE